MTHCDVNKKDKLKVGITDSVLRCSVGIENIDDIIKDFENAFESAV